MVNFKEIYHFSRFQRGSNFIQGGSNCLFRAEGIGGGGHGGLCPPNNLHKYAVLLITKVCHF